MVQAEGIVTERAKITVLVEDTAKRSGFFAEHGLAFWIDAVITMNIGLQASAMFQPAGVQVFQARPGIVAEIIVLFQAGRLQEFAGPSVEEYWPQETK